MGDALAPLPVVCRFSPKPRVTIMGAAAMTMAATQEDDSVSETKSKRYIALIYTDESRDANATPEDMQKTMAAYNAFGEAAGKAGVMDAGDALDGISTATTVRLRNGQRLTTDGPFAETKEQLGGFYILKCKDLDEAIHWAAKIPAAEYGSVEVRPIMEFDD
jgi:hypothetical protein